ncbi:hypothetical protein B0H15DRAFT_932157 [Mycena belliarum]|uniref:Uncharacterized protein n=1 Tax=Mycena belliarum TaxID=1033014 RepID=A0AAD6TZ39_9AGAR|nr:hypothetical protein B0H15DRAFT_932157 [Mycena belliae]
MYCKWYLNFTLSHHMNEGNKRPFKASLSLRSQALRVTDAAIRAGAGQGTTTYAALVACGRRWNRSLRRAGGRDSGACAVCAFEAGRAARGRAQRGLVTGACATCAGAGFPRRGAPCAPILFWHALRTLSRADKPACGFAGGVARAAQGSCEGTAWPRRSHAYAGPRDVAQDGGGECARRGSGASCSTAHASRLVAASRGAELRRCDLRGGKRASEADCGMASPRPISACASCKMAAISANGPTCGASPDGPESARRAGRLADLRGQSRVVRVHPIWVLDRCMVRTTAETWRVGGADAQGVCEWASGRSGSRGLRAMRLRATLRSGRDMDLRRGGGGGGRRAIAARAGETQRRSRAALGGCGCIIVNGAGGTAAGIERDLADGWRGHTGICERATRGDEVETDTTAEERAGQKAKGLEARRAAPLAGSCTRSGSAGSGDAGNDSEEKGADGRNATAVDEIDESLRRQRISASARKVLREPRAVPTSESMLAESARCNVRRGGTTATMEADGWQQDGRKHRTVLEGTRLGRGCRSANVPWSIRDGMLSATWIPRPRLACLDAALSAGPPGP